MNYGLKEKIISLRKKGKAYNEIKKILNCSKGTISYHCCKLENNNILTKENKTHPSKDIISEWTKRTKLIIKNLYNYGILMTEISDILELNLLAVRLFCKNLSKPKYFLLSNYQQVKRRRRKIKILSVLYKGGKCSKCGYNKYFECLTFHHIDPSNKSFTISKKLNHRWKTIKKELNKCIMLCFMCHNELHVENRNEKPLKVYDFGI